MRVYSFKLYQISMGENECLIRGSNLDLSWWKAACGIKTNVLVYIVICFEIGCQRRLKMLEILYFILMSGWTEKFLGIDLS